MYSIGVFTVNSNASIEVYSIFFYFSLLKPTARDESEIDIITSLRLLKTRRNSTVIDKLLNIKDFYTITSIGVLYVQKKIKTKKHRIHLYRGFRFNLTRGPWSMTLKAP